MEIDTAKCRPVSVDDTPAVSESTSETPTVSVAESEAPTDKVAPPVVKKSPKKKKKKTSYKAMMAGMTQRTLDSSKIEKEKADLRKVTGGGAFSKVDKI